MRRTVSEWRRDPLDAGRAKQAANELNNLAEHVFHHRHAGTAEVYLAETPREYRRKLVEHECPDFQLVWDIADAHKHVVLDRRGRQVSRDDQTAPGKLGYGEAKYGEGVYGGTEQLVVQLDDGTRRPLNGIISNVLATWERIVPR